MTRILSNVEVRTAKDRILAITFANRPHHAVTESTLDVECVLDFDDEGNVIGVEVINLKHAAGHAVLDTLDEELFLPTSFLGCSYDDGADALYLALANRRSVQQECVKGTLVLDGERHLIGLRAVLPVEVCINDDLPPHPLPAPRP